MSGHQLESSNVAFLEPSAADISQTGVHRIRCESGDIWVSGSSLLCACPDCSAPMSIRMWLRLADCWRCGTSITLSQEQIEAAQQLEKQVAPQPLPVPEPEPAPAPIPLPPPIGTPSELPLPQFKTKLPPPPPAFNFLSPEDDTPVDARTRAVSYTHLTLPTIYSV